MFEPNSSFFDESFSNYSSSTTDLFNSGQSLDGGSQQMASTRSHSSSVAGNVSSVGTPFFMAPELFESNAVEKLVLVDN